MLEEAEGELQNSNPGKMVILADSEQIWKQALRISNC
jgi:hypothetical protein